MSLPLNGLTQRLTLLYTTRNKPISVAACANLFHHLHEFTQIISCHCLSGYPYFMNVDYLLGTEIQHRLAQFLHIIPYNIQNHCCHVFNNTNVDILSYGHIILGILPRCLYHIVLGNMSLVHLISGLLIRSKTLYLTSQMLSGVFFGSTNDIQTT